MIRREEVYKIGRLGKAHGIKGEISFLLDDDVFDRVDADYLATHYSTSGSSSFTGTTVGMYAVKR